LVAFSRCADVPLENDIRKDLVKEEEKDNQLSNVKDKEVKNMLDTTKDQVIIKKDNKINFPIEEEKNQSDKLDFKSIKNSNDLPPAALTP